MIIKTWNYNTPAEYTYDPSKIEVSNGIVKLKQLISERSPVGHWHFNEENPTPCELRIVDGLDDTTVIEGGGFSSVSPLIMGYSNGFYDGTFRWNNISIPQGAIITNAYIEFVAESDWSTSPVDLLFNITGDDSDNSAQLVSYEDYMARSKTTASVEFLYPLVGIGEIFRTPELKTIIQEIIGRPGWSTNNAINIFFNAPGWVGKEDVIQVRDYDSYPLESALLHIEYSNIGETAIDSSANGNTGTLYGNGTLPIRELGKLNNCLNFNGNSYVSVENSESINIIGSISLECWVKIHTDGTYKGIIGKNYASSYMLSTGNEGDKAISFYYGEWQLIANNAFILDTWHHVVVTFDKDTSTAIIYVDNIAVATNSEPFAPTPLGDEGVLGFGIQPYTDWDYVLDGSLDEILIYKVALTPEEVAYRFNLGNGMEAFDVHYATDKPFIQLSELFHIEYIQNYQDFLETLGIDNEGEIKYTLSNDGINWFYWNGLDWIAPAGENYNTLEEISENIGAFPLLFDFTFRIYLISNGTQKVELQETILKYNTSIFPPNSWDMLTINHNLIGSFGKLTKDIYDSANIAAETAEGKLDLVITEVNKIQPDIIDAKDDYKADVSNLALETSVQEVLLAINDLSGTLTTIINAIAAHRGLTEDKLSRILGLVQENYRIVDPTYDSNGDLVSSGIRLYASKTDCDGNINPFATYSVVATYDVDHHLTSYKVTKE